MNYRSASHAVNMINENLGINQWKSFSWHIMCRVAQIDGCNRY